MFSLSILMCHLVSGLMYLEELEKEDFMISSLSLNHVTHFVSLITLSNINLCHQAYYRTKLHYLLDPFDS